MEIERKTPMETVRQKRMTDMETEREREKAEKVDRDGDRLKGRKS